MNTATEADDAHPMLRNHARRAMDEWREFIQRVVTKGIERGQVRPEINADELTSFFIATLEGGVMMSKLYGDSSHMSRVVLYLDTYLDNFVKS